MVALTAFMLLLSAVPTYAQSVCTGVAVVTEIDAMACPALPVLSGWTFLAHPAPFGIAGLSTGTVAFSVPSENMAMAISGRGADGWTSVVGSTRYRWAFDSSLCFGATVHAGASWYRGFSTHGFVSGTLNARMVTNRWIVGASIQDIALHESTTLPLAAIGVATTVDDVSVGADVVLTGQSPSILLAFATTIMEECRVASSVSSAPFTLTTMVLLGDDTDTRAVAGARFVERLGFALTIGLLLP